MSKDSNRVALALITDSNDNVLMGPRNDSKKWTNPGGHIKVGEDCYEGCVREVLEETGLEAVTIKLEEMGKKGSKLLYLFRVTVDPEQEVDTSKDPDQECPFWEFIDPNEVKDNLHIPLEENWILKKWMGSPISAPVPTKAQADKLTGTPSSEPVSVPDNL